MMEEIVIGFTGTQLGLTTDQHVEMRQHFKQFRNANAGWMHNGDCEGADKEAGELWQAMCGGIHLHPPTVRYKRAWLKAERTEKPRPYLDRNKDIVDASTVLIATPDSPVERIRSGTWSTVRYARKLGRPILIIYPDGSCSRENWPAISRLDHLAGEG